MSTDIFLRAENEPLPPLTFRMGALESLIDESGYIIDVEKRKKGDIYIGAHTLSSKETTINGETKNISYYAGGSLIINTGDDPLFITHPPGTLGLPLVGQGNSAMPIYTSVIDHLEIGENFESSQGLSYCLTANKKSLFKQEIVFGSNEDISFAPYTTGYGMFYAPAGIDFTIQGTDDQYAAGLFCFDKTYMDVYIYDYTDSGKDMWITSNLTSIFDAYLQDYSEKSLCVEFKVDSALQYSTSYYDTNSNYIASSFAVGLNSYLDVTGSISFSTGLDTECFIKLDSPTTTITSSTINLSNPVAQILQTNSLRSSWWNGRDNAMIRLNQTTNLESTTDNGYFPALSMKTQNGNWVIGTVPGEASHCDKLIFTYTKDSGYTDLKNGTTTNQEGVYLHVKFSEEGVVESTALQSRYYGTGNAEYADLVSKPLPGTVYFKIIE